MACWATTLAKEAERLKSVSGTFKGTTDSYMQFAVLALNLIKLVAPWSQKC